MTTTDGLISRTIDVPGARLHYEVRGVGPLLAIVGSPMGAADFAPLAHAMAATHTVVTLDPRGYGASPLDDPRSASTPEIRADDVVAILDALGADSADLFGSSGGAVTGLALVSRHPARIRTLVAHEPPVLELLPDADARRANTDDIIETFHRDGPGAAFGKFMASAGFGPGEGGPPPGPEPTPQEMERQFAEATRFFDYDLGSTTRFVPDEALRTSSTRIVIGLGEGSGKLVTTPTSRAAAEFLDAELATFPSDHGGFIDEPGAFADRLREVLGAKVH